MKQALSSVLNFSRPFVLLLGAIAISTPARADSYVCCVSVYSDVATILCDGGSSCDVYHNGHWFTILKSTADMVCN